LNLPSKKIWGIFLVSLAFVGGFFFISRGGINKLSQKIGYKVQNFNEVKSLQVVSDLNSAKDSDNDGLPDWEESLWKTDLLNPDTDGDGAKDGDEIKQGRNPLVKGPNDKLNKDSITFVDQNKNKAASYEISSDQVSITQQIANDATTQYLKLQDAGNLNADTKKQLIDSLVNSYKPTEATIKYSLSSLNIVNDGTKESDKKYGNDLIFAVSSYPDIASTDPYEIFNNSTNGNDNNAGAKLSEIAKYYILLAEDLSKIPVPAALSKNHLDIINTHYIMGQGIFEMSLYDSDPINALGGLQKFASYSTVQVQNYKNVMSYLKKNNITFNKDEAGYFWEISNM